MQDMHQLHDLLSVFMKGLLICMQSETAQSCSLQNMLALVVSNGSNLADISFMPAKETAHAPGHIPSVLVLVLCLCQPLVICSESFPGQYAMCVCVWLWDTPCILEQVTYAPLCMSRLAPYHMVFDSLRSPRLTM